MFGSRFCYLFSYGGPQFDAQSYLLSTTCESHLECAELWDKTDMKWIFLALRPNYSAAISGEMQRPRVRFAPIKTEEQMDRRKRRIAQAAAM